MSAFRVILALLMAHGCGPDVVYATLEDDGAQHCESLVICEELPEPDAYAAKCEDKILDDGDSALDEGRRCATAYETLVHCLAGLSCEEYRDWGAHYANTDQSLAYPCDAPTDVFLGDCTETWFASTVKR